MKFFSTIRDVYKKISCIFFPPICLHCEREMKDNKYLFCPACSELIELVNLSKNCCYSYLFERIGPASTLFSCFKKGSHTLFSRTLASYLYLQMDRMEWPFFDGVLMSKEYFLKDLVREFCLLSHLQTVYFPKMGKTYLRIETEIDLESYQKMTSKDMKIYVLAIFCKDKNK